jgi:site-specific DNA-methyltransferase (cytosine-N4-specific)
MNSYRFYWPSYKLFPYETDFALRELRKLSHNDEVVNNPLFAEVLTTKQEPHFDRLTYFSFFENGNGRSETQQHLFETYGSIQNGNAKQSTRYSVHGLHEYKGKFNPQVVRFLLNYLGLSSGSQVLDPFCGSGTSIVESLHYGISGKGCDLNPLAAYITNAKIRALVADADLLIGIRSRIETRYLKARRTKFNLEENPRAKYLAVWFPSDNLKTIELLRTIIVEEALEYADIFLVILSNLLRDYSNQEPLDLRIRRRKSPFPPVEMSHQFFKNCSNFLLQKHNFDRICRIRDSLCSLAHCTDILDATIETFSQKRGRLFDAAITSPPYATALPYIDTQRLSIVWLELGGPSDLGPLESSLIGAREFERLERSEWNERFLENHSDLPAEVYRYCKLLSRSVGGLDGFRRLAVPTNLYRYFSQMSRMFRSVKELLKPKAPFALIVGHNHTTLGGKRFDIDTPKHLAKLALAAGWSMREVIPMQTYQRYGLHQKNAVAREDLIILES